MAIVPTLLCGNDKNRWSLWRKERFMDRNIYSDIHLHKLVSTKDDYEKHSRMGNKTLISLIHKPSLTVPLHDIKFSIVIIFISNDCIQLNCSWCSTAGMTFTCFVK